MRGIDTVTDTAGGGKRKIQSGRGGVCRLGSLGAHGVAREGQRKGKEGKGLLQEGTAAKGL